MSNQPTIVGIDISSESSTTVDVIIDCHGYPISQRVVDGIAWTFGVGEEAAKLMIASAIRAVEEPPAFRDLLGRLVSKDSLEAPVISLDLPIKKARNLRDATPWTHKRQPWQAHRSKRRKR
jgi:hypothetical protein